jgi:hypothetical protein
MMYMKSSSPGVTLRDLIDIQACPQGHTLLWRTSIRVLRQARQHLETSRDSTNYTGEPNMKFITTVLATAMSMAIAGQAAAHSDAVCGDPRHPLLSVADFNGDGVVDGKDVSMIGQKNGQSNKAYYALYDLNADGVIDGQDVSMAANQIGMTSTPLDQWLARQYNRFEQLQNISGHDTISAMGYQQLGGPLKGHGVHWMNQAGMFSIAGFRNADQTIAEGLNVTSDGSDIPALFWGEHAVPLFNDPSSPTGLSTLDYPAPFGVWNNERVQAFADSPPDFIPGVEENWHTHAGTCLTVWDVGSGPEWQTNQYTSNAECQAMPNLAPFFDPSSGMMVNLWGNFWMLHTWLFDLNPRGVFANTHPCIDPEAPDEETINGGREVPMWFQMHGGHS